MRCASLVALLVAGAGCRGERLPDLRPREGQSRVSVLAWNVGRVHGGWDSRATSAHVKQVARVIARAQPDFVALQELRGRRQLDKLLARLEGRYQGALADGDGYDRHTAVLVRAGLKPRFSTVRTPANRAWQTARVVLGERLAVAVVSVHLDAFGPARRARQARELAAWSDAAAADAVLLAGDLNVDAERAAEAGRDSDDLAAYRSMVRRHQDLGRFAGGTTLLGTRLDYLLGRSARLRDGRVRVLRDARIKWMDHYPVYGVFLLDRSPLLL